MISILDKYIRGEKVLILGFGREGKSSFHFIKKHFPQIDISVADRNQGLDKSETLKIGDENLFLGDDYLEAIQNFNVIIKSPGISITAVQKKYKDKIWLSQTGLFLEAYHRQIIGITGTKGKSTTSSLIHHILKCAGTYSILVGNIGQPPFDLIDQINPETHIVFELSANQLEFVNHAPHIAILLNLFQEHLDYFGSIEKYFDAKMNIVKLQEAGDVFIFDSGNKNIGEQLKPIALKPKVFSFNENDNGQIVSSNAILKKIEFSNYKLKGRHNLKNITAAALACISAGVGIEEIISGVEAFSPLEHRLEFVGNYCGIDFYNDSISTIPESTVEAVKTIKNIQTLILGGFDRGIDYTFLLNFLSTSSALTLIFTGPAGKRMMAEYQALKDKNQQIYFIEQFNDMSNLLQKTEKGKACVLSPAASSYDQFNDFEERGRAFKKMAESLKASCL